MTYKISVRQQRTATETYDAADHRDALAHATAAALPPLESGYTVNITVKPIPPKQSAPKERPAGHTAHLFN